MMVIMRKRLGPIFYVYILFDHCGIARYVGKGVDDRWLDHERRRDLKNHSKQAFIDATLQAIGEIPKIKIGENLLENDALNIERLFIAAIGKAPSGPLTNLTDGGQGLSGYVPSTETLALFSKRSKEYMDRLHPNERIIRATRASHSVPPDIRSSTAKNRWAKRSSEERSEIVRRGHASQTPSQRSQRAKDRWAKLTPEECNAILSKSRKGRDPEKARLAGLKLAASMTFDQRSAAGKRCAINMTEQQKKERANKGWITRREKAARPRVQTTPHQS